MGILKQIFCSFFDKSYENGREFGEIIGHDSIKIVFKKAVLSKRPVHILLVGRPGTAKTMFLTELMRSIKHSYFIVGSNTTKAGLVNQLFEKRPKFLLIDELDKMRGQDQNALLHLMETGIISETKINKTRHSELTSWVFASANTSEKIIEPLLSRFLVLQIPDYIFGEFKEIAHDRLAKERIEPQLAEVIVHEVWNELGSRDIRDVVKIARLSDTVTDVHHMIRMMKGSPNFKRKYKYTDSAAID